MGISRQFRRFWRTIKARILSSFLDADEVRLINLLGGSTVTLGFVKNAQDQPLTIILSRGKLLRREHFHYTKSGAISFINDIQRGIILGRRDVVLEQELYEQGFYVKFIERSQLWRNEAFVKRELQRFIMA